MPASKENAREWREASSVPSHYYDAADEGRAGLRVSRWIERRSDIASMVRSRRKRYAQWAEAVHGLPGVEPLLPELPAHVAPYMFALHVADPPRLFYPLKRIGVPIYRWDDMAVSDCPVSQRYRQGLFHLPCHQMLTDAEMHWMTAAVRAAACRG
ncbi:MAG: DegT/DnrJ/EryC1/StrS family aminotransferase [Comamonadaceae bacterium]|nr:DegT/DnrJ/EryC1/StrS family aminotransferase [Comamonadaceae bacterium]